MLSSTLEAFSPTAVSDVDFGKSLLPRWQRTQAKTKHQGSENESSHGNIQPDHYMSKRQPMNQDKSDHFNSTTYSKEFCQRLLLFFFSGTFAKKKKKKNLLVRGNGQEDKWHSNQMNETKEREMSSSLLSEQSCSNPGHNVDAKVWVAIHPHKKKKKLNSFFQNSFKKNLCDGKKKIFLKLEEKNGD
ncbi:hypothetical protein RFI_13845 [Reticulomyxa filosa]|uniref:Uncharacterized protein n=1 Tax=Reticulomyxa filosa TaxID=46433 RepID=X6NBG0_RETFI|nr:hypothetical protein RFI_13845 [Reticulomyxa filosa]|eukprot:ETO23336.1 hypothetical protein RFI_13845 [Reticulomyxa filosa]